MNLKLYGFLILIVLFGCKNSQSEKLKINEQRTLELKFPSPPQILNESTSLNGEKIHYTIKTLALDSTFLVQYQIEFDQPIDTSMTFQKDFFGGFLNYVLNDIGIKLGKISKSNFKGINGFDFELLILEPNNDYKIFHGNALILGKNASIWFVLDFSSLHSEATSDFLNNFELKE